MAGSRTLKLSILADVDNLKKNLGEGSKEVEGFGGKVEKFGKVAAAAFAAAAAAAAAYAGKLLVDGVKAAIEDEAAQKRLETALRNVTDATDQQVAAVEDQILKMSLAYGVADDQLRPAFQRLAVATGDLKTAEDGLALALDISAATGKSVEQVANALGKAYEGNTGALGRLGVGLSSAEIKTLGLDGTMKALAATFGGAATQQADTLQGRIARLRVAFDETVETVGTYLLPLIEKLLRFIVDVAIPKFQDFKRTAIDPVIKSIKDNEDTLRSLYEFASTILEPFVRLTLGNAIKGIGTVASGIVGAVSIAVRALEPIINAAISGINAVIRAKNLLLPGEDTPTIGKVDFSKAAAATTNLGSRPLGGVAAVAAPSRISSTPEPTVTEKKAVASAAKAADRVVFGAGILNAGSFRLGEAREMGQLTINVNAPSAIDEEGFTRSVVEALNRTNGRTGGGGALLAL